MVTIRGRCIIKRTREDKTRPNTFRLSAKLIELTRAGEEPLRDIGRMLEHIAALKSADESLATARGTSSTDHRNQDADGVDHAAAAATAAAVSSHGESPNRVGVAADGSSSRDGEHAGGLDAHADRDSDSVVDDPESVLTKEFHARNGRLYPTWERCTMVYTASFEEFLESAEERAGQLCGLRMQVTDQEEGREGGMKKEGKGACV